jgi:RNA 2',3'-cyclic 3'-phosphodiesterase
MRLFIALPLSEPSRRHITETLVPAKDRFSRLKWVKEENLHLTLQFLGDCSSREVEELLAVFSGRTLESKGCPVSWESISAFPSEKSPGVLHLPVKGGAACIKEIYREVSELISGLIKNRGEISPGVHSFIPHITIARAGRGRPTVPLEQVRSVLGNISGESHINRVSLFHSILEKQGPRYKETGFLCLREDT